ncbi:hypothetical protein Sme01_30740 [Sphaerisporangium melleum]|uniref:Uncharacterized protein n=1 Tax=Sphaerisporangium melleum TaxID=321316 RepID=A0A917R8J8_9ACTN|nr:hypothetical protein GCM10007964_42170 [Sphaerisporangium melleum]GII70598.1 hypothetical protein Sme01_30740 [Sphaerisporangium melleum]
MGTANGSGERVADRTRGPLLGHRGSATAREEPARVLSPPDAAPPARTGMRGSRRRGVTEYGWRLANDGVRLGRTASG